MRYFNKNITHLDKINNAKVAGKKIWIDLDNSPHVPFFIPIINELEKKGHTVFITTRDCFQVCNLADYHKLQHTKIGKHYGANKALKVFGTFYRSVQMAPAIIREKPDISLSHGSRSLIILSYFMRIKTIQIFDYEHAQSIPFIKPSLGIAPEVIKDPSIAKHFKYGIRGYEGLKEDVYVASFKPCPDIFKKLNLNLNEIIVTIRPPATEAHYHNPESEALFIEVVEYLGSVPNLRMVILPRNEITQKDFVKKKWALLCENKKIIIPDEALNGLDLIYFSDFVVSGGGTMNREAAALKVPVFSIFRGKIGAVDRYLAEQGRLKLIEKVEDVRKNILPVKRKIDPEIQYSDRRALKQIMAAIEEILYL